MEQNETVSRIRELTTIRERQGGLSLGHDTELHELQLKANEHNWIYW